MAYSVETLKVKRRNAKNNRKTYKNRKDTIKKPYDNCWKLDDYYTKIRKKVEECTNEIHDGIKGMSSVVDSKCSTIEDKREKQSLTNQYSFSQAMNYMSNEMNRCQDLIDYYDRIVADYERQIKDQGGIILPWE